MFHKTDYTTVNEITDLKLKKVNHIEVHYFFLLQQLLRQQKIHRTIMCKQSQIKKWGGLYS